MHFKITFKSLRGHEAQLSNCLSSSYKMGHQQLVYSWHFIAGGICIKICYIKQYCKHVLQNR